MQPHNLRGLSANTLFHFTSSLDNLLNILTNEFHSNFCLENLNILEELPVTEMAIPMLSFCDPLVANWSSPQRLWRLRHRDD
jgi:hypothetical protein